MRIPPGRISGHLETHLGLRDYQVIQQDPRRVLLRLGPAHDPLHVPAAVEAYLKSLLGEDIQLDVEAVEAGEFPVKYRPVISKVA